MAQKKLDSLGRRKRPKLHNDMIVVRVSKDLKKRFLEYCRKTGDSAGPVLRKYIIKLLRNVGL